MKSVFADKIEEGLRKATEVTTPTAGTTTAAGSFLGFLNEYGVAIGVIITVLSFSVNWYYREKADRRHEREHQQKLASIKSPAE